MTAHIRITLDTHHATPLPPTTLRSRVIAESSGSVRRCGRRDDLSGLRETCTESDEQCGASGVRSTGP